MKTLKFNKITLIIGDESKLEVMMSLNKLTTPNFTIVSDLDLYCPTSQFRKTSKVIENMGKPKIIIFTNSPYVLGHLDLCMKSFQLQNDSVIPSSSWLNPDDLTVYEIVDGNCKELKIERALIPDDNYLNNQLEILNDTFAELIHSK